MQFALVRKLETKLEIVESNQFRCSGMMNDYARSSGVRPFPDWFVRT